MKKHLSVFELYLRSSLSRLLLILIVMAAAELALFERLAVGGGVQGFAEATGASHIAAVFVLAAAATMVLCTGLSGRAGSVGYTLQRLRISEREVFLWHSLSNAGMLLILWGWQILILYGLTRRYLASGLYVQGPQGIYIDFYRNAFLHAVMPLAYTALWLRDFLLVASFSVALACIELTRRAGGEGVSGLSLGCTFFCIYQAVRSPAALGSPMGFQIFFTAAGCLVIILSGLDKAHRGVRREETEYVPLSQQM